VIEVNNVKNKLDELKSRIEDLSDPEKGILMDLVEIIQDLVENFSMCSESPREISLIEFIKKKKLESHGDRVVGIAYYLYKYRGLDPFNVKDIEKMYEEARLNLPKNLSDITAKQAKKGYFIECKEKKDGLKAWKISARGIEYIESLPEAEGC